MIEKALLTSTTQEWETPNYIFDYFNNIFHFTLDVCANAKNKKVERYFSPEDDGLSKSWAGEKVWMNPPYSPRRKGVPGQVDWVKKAYEEVRYGECLSATCLLPVRSDTILFHEYVMKSCFVFFLRGRLKFANKEGNNNGFAVFPSMVVTFEKSYYNIYQQEEPDPCFTSLRIKIT